MPVLPELAKRFSQLTPQQALLEAIIYAEAAKISAEAALFAVDPQNPCGLDDRRRNASGSIEDGKSNLQKSRVCWDRAQQHPGLELSDALFAKLIAYSRLAKVQNAAADLRYKAFLDQYFPNR